MTEEEFNQSIDCCFPYFDESEWQRLVEIGTALSPNSAFMVLHEICRPGRSLNAKPDHLEKIANVWSTYFHHPLAERLHSVALRCINGEQIPIQEALDHFNEIRKFKNQYNALTIIYFACDDFEDRLDTAYNQIIQEWRTA